MLRQEKGSAPIGQFWFSLKLLCDQPPELSVAFFSLIFRRNDKARRRLCVCCFYFCLSYLRCAATQSEGDYTVVVAAACRFTNAHHLFHRQRGDYGEVAGPR